MHVTYAYSLALSTTELMVLIVMTSRIKALAETNYFRTSDSLIVNNLEFRFVLKEYVYGNFQPLFYIMMNKN